MSFNPKLKDEGVIAIINQIPKTISVLAFVECGITDKAGQEIINWAVKANNINGIYIEGNFFTENMEEKFKKLRAEKPQLTFLRKWHSKWKNRISS